MKNSPVIDFNQIKKINANIFKLEVLKLCSYTPDKYRAIPILPAMQAYTTYVIDMKQANKEYKSFGSWLLTEI